MSRASSRPALHPSSEPAHKSPAATFVPSSARRARAGARLDARNAGPIVAAIAPPYKVIKSGSQRQQDHAKRLDLQGPGGQGGSQASEGTAAAWAEGGRLRSWPGLAWLGAEGEAGRRGQERWGGPRWGWGGKVGAAIVSARGGVSVPRPRACTMEVERLWDGERWVSAEARRVGWTGTAAAEGDRSTAGRAGDASRSTEALAESAAARQQRPLFQAVRALLPHDACKPRIASREARAPHQARARQTRLPPC